MTVAAPSVTERNKKSQSILHIERLTAFCFVPLVHSYGVPSLGLLARHQHKFMRQIMLGSSFVVHVSVVVVNTRIGRGEAAAQKVKHEAKPRSGITSRALHIIK